MNARFNFRFALVFEMPRTLCVTLILSECSVISAHDIISTKVLKCFFLILSDSMVFDCQSLLQ